MTWQHGIYFIIVSEIMIARKMTLSTCCMAATVLLLMMIMRKYSVLYHRLVATIIGL